MTSPLRRLAAALTLPAVAALADAPGLPGLPDTPPFAEAIEVRELEVHFDDSVLPPLESLGRRADGDFLVLVDGRPLEPSTSSEIAERSERLGDALLWFDPDLASPAALAAAARALLDPPSALVAAERLRLVLADPAERREALDLTGSTLGMAERLAAAARRWDQAEPGRPSLERRLRALDRLAAATAVRDRGGPRALVVAADAWGVDGDWLDDLAIAESGGAPTRPATERLEQVARASAAAGWTTLALAPPLVETTTWARSARHETVTVGGNLSHRFPMATFPWRRATPSASESTRFDVATDLGLRPWAHLVRAGSGTVVGDALGLTRALERVAERRRLLLRLPERPPGPLSPIEVRWSGGDGRTLPASRWLAHGSPPELTAARLRALAAGDLGLDATAHASVREGGGSRVACWPPSGSSSSPRRWLRASTIGRAGPPGAAPGASVSLGPVAESAAAEPCAPLPPAPPGPGATIVLLEDLETGSWTGELLHTAP